MSDDAIRAVFVRAGQEISAAIAYGHADEAFTVEELPHLFDMVAKTSFSMGLHIGVALGALDSNAAAAVRSFMDRDVFEDAQDVAARTNGDTLAFIEAVRAR